MGKSGKCPFNPTSSTFTYTSTMTDTYINININIDININIIIIAKIQDHLLDLGLDLGFVLVLATRET